MGNFWDADRITLGDAFDNLVPLMDERIDRLKKAWRDMGDWLEDAWSDTARWWGEKWDKARSLSDSIRDLFDDAKNFVRRRDPLTLDLDGDGIETVAATGSILFDHDGDGIRNGTGWIGSDDGLLVLDRNGNGTIDSGKELFGADTVLPNGHLAKSGFEALSGLDTNADGLFDASDAQFSAVRVWRDLNQDGVSQSAELFTLQALGVASITLTPTDTTDVNLGNGNVIDNRGTYRRTDGTNGLAGDLQLAVENFYRDFSGSLDPVTVSDAARALPGLNGSGSVRDLDEAASLSGDLLTAVQGLTPGMSRDDMRSRIDQIVGLWAGTSTMETSEEILEDIQTQKVFYYGAIPVEVANKGQTAVWEWTKAQHNMLSPIIAILERFNGSTFLSVRGDTASTGGSTFSAQSGGGGSGASSGMYVFVALQPEQVTALLAAYEALKDSIYGALVLRTRLQPYLETLTLDFADGEIRIDYSGLDARLEATRAADPTVALQDLMDLRKYGGGLLNRGAWNGESTLIDWARDAVETVEGRAALVDVGIDVSDGTCEGAGEANIAVGDSSDDVLDGRAGDDLLAGFGGSDTLLGGEGDDRLFGGADNDALDGGAGDDFLVGGDGNDTLNGSTGANRLQGGAGNDVLGVHYNAKDNVLEGGTGNDVMTGGYYADTYRFNLGDGQDTVIETYDYGTVDTLEFGAGIDQDDLWFRRVGNDLVLSVINSTDSVEINDWFLGSSSKVEATKFADGTTLTVAQVESLVAAMASYSPPAGSNSPSGYSMSSSSEAALAPSA